MNTTTTTPTVKLGFYTFKPLASAFEANIVYEDDMPQFPDDAGYKSTLAQLRQSPEAARLIELVADDAVAIAQANVRRCSGDAWSMAAAELHMMAIDLIIEKSIPIEQFVVADYVIKRIKDRLGLAVCTRAGLDSLRLLLTDTVGPVCYLSAQQQELL